MDSSGYQSLLDHFGERAPALYGTWIGLVTIAANCHDRGILRNSRGNPLTISHLSRMTGFDAGLFSELFAWASSPEVGWLETEPAPNTHETTEKTIENPVILPSSGNSPDVLPTSPEKTGGEGNGIRRELEGNTLSNTTREIEKVISKFPNNPDFKEVWAQWKAHRIQKHKPLAPAEEQQQLYELGRFDAVEAIAMVRYSIGRGALNLITNGDHARARESPGIAPGLSRRGGYAHRTSNADLLSKILG